VGTPLNLQGMKKWNELHNTSKAWIIILAGFATLLALFLYPFLSENLSRSEENSKRDRCDREYKSLFLSEHSAKMKMYASDVVKDQHALLMYNYNNESNVIVQKYSMKFPVDFAQSYLLKSGVVVQTGAFEGDESISRSVLCDSLISLAVITHDGKIEEQEILGDSILLVQFKACRWGLSGDTLISNYLLYSSRSGTPDPKLDKAVSIAMALVKRNQDMYLVLLIEGKVKPSIDLLHQILHVDAR